MREDFVDETDLGGEVRTVDMEGKEAANVAYRGQSVVWLKGKLWRVIEREELPKPPMIKTAGF